MADSGGPPAMGRWAGGASPPLTMGRPPENFELFNFEMTCFGVFCGANLTSLVTTKAAKITHQVHGESLTADVTKRN